MIVYKKADEWYIEQHWVTKKMKNKNKQTNKQKLETCRQNGSQTGNSKVTAVVLIHLRCLLFVIFRRIKCNEEQQVMNCSFCSLANSVLKFSTEFFIFIEHLKNWFFFTFFDRYFCSMLPWESKFDAKFLFMVFNRLKDYLGRAPTLCTRG